MILTLAFHLLITQTHAAGVIRVRPHVVVVPGTKVNLGQLVDSEGVSATTVEQLTAIEISSAPSQGEHQEISNTALLGWLRPIVKAERQKSNSTVHLIVPNKVLLDTQARQLMPETIRQELIQAWQPLCTECRIDIDNLSLPAVSGARDWTLKIRPELPKGSFAVAIEITKNSGDKMPAWVSGRLSVQRRVPVATRMISPDEVLKGQDIKWEFRDTSFAIDGIPSEEDLIGKRLKQGLRAGDSIWMGMLAREKAIRRGDPVHLRAVGDDWEVSLQVVAQQDSYLGDMVNFKHPKTNSPLVGRVVGQDEVELQ